MSKHKSFTLIELLVVIVIFMIVFLITMAFVKLAAGQVKSAHTKMLANEVRNATETINQKMNNANATNGAINGFGTLAGNTILAVVSSDSATKTCSFFGLNGSTLYMLQQDCSLANPTAVNANTWNKLTNSDKVTVTDFNLTLLGNVSDPPYLTLTINAHDKDPQYKDDNKIDFQSSYTIDYATWKGMGN